MKTYSEVENATTNVSLPYLKLVEHWVSQQTVDQNPIIVSYTTS